MPELRVHLPYVRAAPAPDDPGPLEFVHGSVGHRGILCCGDVTVWQAGRSVRVSCKVGSVFDVGRPVDAVPVYVARTALHDGRPAIVAPDEMLTTAIYCGDHAAALIYDPDGFAGAYGQTVRVALWARRRSMRW